jgi:hypothetical protein
MSTETKEPKFKPRFYSHKDEPIVFMYPELEGITFFVQGRRVVGGWVSCPPIPVPVEKNEILEDKIEIKGVKEYMKEIEEDLVNNTAPIHRNGIKRTIADYLRLIAEDIEMGGQEP